MSEIILQICSPKNLRNFFLTKSLFISGYDFPAVVIVFLNAVIGLTITVIYKYTNAIAKTFCTAVATVVLFIVNATLFNLPASLNSVLSCVVVFVATYLYTQGAVPTPNPVSTNGSKSSNGDYDKLPMSQMDIIEEAPTRRSRMFGQFTARRLGALIFTAVIITSLVISFQTISSGTQPAPERPLSNDTAGMPVTSNKNAEAPMAIASDTLRQSDLSGIILPPSASFFDDILVILHFNNPRYNHLPILLEQYGKVFKNMVVCGPEKHPLIDVVCARGKYGLYIYL